MKRLFLMMILAGLITPASLMAQKVYKSGNKIILESTEETGMAVGTTTNISKTAIYDVFEAKENILGQISGANNNQNHPINATVYNKLEIANVESVVILNWVNAMNYCKNLTEAGNSDWRLPTQRELMLIWIFKPAIEGLGGLAFENRDYHCATESSGINSWRVHFGTGIHDYSWKSSSTMAKARCVREIL